MERHYCKLCPKIFSSGRALGGHMRSHLAPLPLPPKNPQEEEEYIGDCTESTLSSSSEEVGGSGGGGGGGERGISSEEKAMVYRLREKPRRSFRVVDPEFLDAAVVHGGEIETDSTRKPTRKRSKRARQMRLESEKLSSVESPAELEPASSVSESSPEEDVALCLMMLSRDVRVRKPSRIRVEYRCGSCNRVFRSSQALGSHKTIHKKKNFEEDPKENVGRKAHECLICGKVFGSGQALGGHKRSHISVGPSTNEGSTSAEILIDLNLPASTEDEDFTQLELCSF